MSFTRAATRTTVVIVTSRSKQACDKTACPSGKITETTGSGPASWRHNNSLAGISDIVGNAYEWTPGARLVDGEVHIIKDNDMSLDDTDHSANSSAWRAIDYQTGDLVSPGHANAVRFALSGAAGGTLVINSGGNFRDIAGKAISAEAQAVLK